MVEHIAARRLPSVDLPTMIERMERYSISEQLAFTGAFLDEATELLQRFTTHDYALRRFIDDMGGLVASEASFAPPQTFNLFRNSRFGVRVNVWSRVKPTAFAEREKTFYAYGLAHNHDFNFLTAGYFGPGYLTDVCEIDPSETLLPAGSSIQLKNPATVQLDQGSVLQFKAYSDVHSQAPPDDLSISVNLLSLMNPKGYEQIIVDMDEQILIEQVIDGDAGRMATMIDLASAFPTSRTPELIQRIASESQRSMVRETALSHLRTASQPVGVAG